MRAKMTIQRGGYNGHAVTIATRVDVSVRDGLARITFLDSPAADELVLSEADALGLLEQIRASKRPKPEAEVPTHELGGEGG
jgi:hypothetical protein